MKLHIRFRNHYSRMGRSLVVCLVRRRGLYLLTLITDAANRLGRTSLPVCENVGVLLVELDLQIASLHAIMLYEGVAEGSSEGTCYMSGSQGNGEGRGCLAALTSTTGLITAGLGCLTAVLTFLGALSQGWLTPNEPGPTPVRQTESDPRPAPSPDVHTDPRPAPKPSNGSGKPTSSPTPQGSLEALVPEQVGDYFVREQLTYVSNNIGATESVEAEYSTDQGPLNFYVWAYSSATEAERGKQAVIQYYSQGDTVVAEVQVPDAPGAQGGTGVELYQSLGATQIIWTDDSHLAAIDSPATLTAEAFFDALYAQRWGE